MGCNGAAVQACGPTPLHTPNTVPSHPILSPSLNPPHPPPPPTTQIFLPDGWLAAAYEELRAAGAVCVADEVQTGFGRAGDAFWGFELSGVAPDVVVMGKPIGNGVPLAAVAVTRALAEAFSGQEYL